MEGEEAFDRHLCELANGIFRQYWGMIRKEREEKGRGMAVFVILQQPLPSGSNCKYSYLIEGTDEWNTVTEDHADVLKTYDPQKHVMVSILFMIGPDESKGKLFIINETDGEIVKS